MNVSRSSLGCWATWWRLLLELPHLYPWWIQVVHTSRWTVPEYGQSMATSQRGGRRTVERGRWQTAKSPVENHKLANCHWFTCLVATRNDGRGWENGEWQVIADKSWGGCWVFNVASMESNSQDSQSENAETQSKTMIRLRFCFLHVCLCECGWLTT